MPLFNKICYILALISFGNLASFAHAQNLDTSGQGIGITFMKPPSGSGLERLKMKSEVLGMIEDSTWRQLLERANFVVFPSEGKENSYTVELEVRAVSLPDSIAIELTKAGLPQLVDYVKLHADITLSDAWDASAVQNGSVHIVGLLIRNLTLNWDEVNLSVHGAVNLGETGLVNGKIDAKVSPWESAMQLASLANGVQVEALDTLLNVMSEDENVALSFTIVEGRVKIGPVTIATIPAFYAAQE
ncbi:MAG: DUF2125 domain-containing protein [Paracoccaceae bacterium]